ncbi:uncharacterized protein LOC126904162 [Daktulosphaira vitifoliae]|uniref:uncharacterized protein LOC126904162 n=1 Tax=Daktulosphaira vitifoliae TaxID=58002 RepID=UPI0021AA827B|nr:uncharacterized protein LOC126904162 [Daktulosphaira vitifoliae]
MKNLGFELNDLFDIAQVDALNLMSLQEDKDFLLMQRQNGRPGIMLGVDMNIAQKEKRANERLKMSEKRRKRSYDEIQSLNAQVEMCSSSESDVTEDDFNKPGSSKMYVKQPTRGSIDFITSKLAAALDKCKISDRDAVHILISTEEALGGDVEKLIINL